MNNAHAHKREKEQQNKPYQDSIGHVSSHAHTSMQGNTPAEHNNKGKQQQTALTTTTTNDLVISVNRTKVHNKEKKEGRYNKPVQ